MSAHFFLDLFLELLEVKKHFTLLLDWKDPHVAIIVIDEGDVIPASSNRRLLSRFPYVGVNQIKEAFTYMSIL